MAIVRILQLITQAHKIGVMPLAVCLLIFAVTVCVFVAYNNFSKSVQDSNILAKPKVAPTPPSYQPRLIDLKEANREYGGEDLYVITSGRQLGPFKMEHLRTFLHQDLVSSSDLTTRAGSQRWEPLSNVLREFEGNQALVQNHHSSDQDVPIYVANGTSQMGPYKREQVLQFLSMGLIQQETQIRFEGVTSWMSVASAFKLQTGKKHAISICEEPRDAIAKLRRIPLVAWVTWGILLAFWELAELVRVVLFADVSVLEAQAQSLSTGSSQFNDFLGSLSSFFSGTSYEDSSTRYQALSNQYDLDSLILFLCLVVQIGLACGFMASLFVVSRKIDSENPISTLINKFKAGQLQLDPVLIVLVGAIVFLGLPQALCLAYGNNVLSSLISMLNEPIAFTTWVWFYCLLSQPSGK